MKKDEYVPPKIRCEAGKGTGRQCKKWATIKTGKTIMPRCFSHGG